MLMIDYALILAMLLLAALAVAMGFGAWVSQSGPFPDSSPEMAPVLQVLHAIGAVMCGQLIILALVGARVVYWLTTSS